MTHDELVAYAERNGMVIVDRAAYEADCAEIARLTIEQTDLDLELRMLLGDA